MTKSSKSRSVRFSLYLITPVLAAGLLLSCLRQDSASQFKTESQILKAPDTTKGDIYGGAVGISGEFAFVAAEWDDDAGKDSGSVWVFRRDGRTWRPEQKLHAPDAAKGDNFGRSIAIDGHVAVIGTHWDDSKTAINAGSATVFRYDGKRWVAEQKLTAKNGANWDSMGNAVSIDGDWIAVSAWRHDGVGPDSGAVYLFHREGKQWKPTQELSPKDAHAEDQFGRGVRISGNALIVGAWNNDALGADSGAAYIFRLSDGRWQEEQKLIAKNGKAGDQLGFTVALDGDVALVSAHKHNAGKRMSGAAYIFRFDGEHWQEEQMLSAKQPQEGEWLGWALALDDDLAVLGGQFTYRKGHLKKGSAYVFRRVEGRWQQSDRLAPSDGHPGDVFGCIIAMDNDRAVIGAWRNNQDGDQSGRAYLFEDL